tara:strand:- start:26 stop:559 length:534 start_codon:yes stop_codon:yes gene_type:complete
MRIIIFLFISTCCFAQKTFVENSKLSFFSAAPLEDISAVSNKLQGVVDFETGNFFFRVPIHTFIFPSSLMQKHFNEKYMETEKYSLSSFKGSFDESIMIGENQKTRINAQGILNIHGIDQSVSIETELSIQNKTVEFKSKFYVYLRDYKIKVPKIVRMNIADTIQVNVSGVLKERNQ